VKRLVLSLFIGLVAACSTPGSGKGSDQSDTNDSGDSGAGTGGGSGGDAGDDSGEDSGEDSGTPAGGPWAVIGGIYGSQYAEGVAVNGDGDVFFGGSFENGIDLGDGGFASRGRDDLLVGTVRGEDGGLVWDIATGDGGSEVVYDVAVAPDGTLYAAGWFEGDLDFPDGTLTSKGDYDGFVARWDAAGTFAWVVQLGGTGDDRMRAVSADDAGVCVAGFSSNGITGTGLPLSGVSLLDGIVVCVEANGTPVWGDVLGFGSGTAPALAITVDPAGVHAGGYFTGELDLGEGRVASAGDRDGWVKRYARDGSAGQGVALGSTGDQEVRGLAAVDGSTAVVGYWAGGPFSDAGELPRGGQDAFLLVLDGSLLPSTELLFGGDGTDSALDVAARADGALAIIGASDGNLNLAEDHPALGDDDLFVGIWQGSWTASARYGGPGEDIGRSVDWLPSGDVVLGGTTFGGITIGGTTLEGAGDRDLLLARVTL
jgi:hypothetical protein